MLAAAWLMLSSLLYSLQLQTGSFPKPLTEEEERHYLMLAAQGDLDALHGCTAHHTRAQQHIHIVFDAVFLLKSSVFHQSLTMTGLILSRLEMFVVIFSVFIGNGGAKNRPALCVINQE